MASGGQGGQGDRRRQRFKKKPPLVPPSFDGPRRRAPPLQMKKVDLPTSTKIGLIIGAAIAAGFSMLIMRQAVMYSPLESSKDKSDAGADGDQEKKSPPRMTPQEFMKFLPLAAKPKSLSTVTPPRAADISHLRAVLVGPRPPAPVASTETSTKPFRPAYGPEFLTRLCGYARGQWGELLGLESAAAEGGGVSVVVFYAPDEDKDLSDVTWNGVFDRYLPRVLPGDEQLPLRERLLAQKEGFKGKQVVEPVSLPLLSASGDAEAEAAVKAFIEGPPDVTAAERLLRSQLGVAGTPDGRVATSLLSMSPQYLVPRAVARGAAAAALAGKPINTSGKGDASRQPVAVSVIG